MSLFAGPTLEERLAAAGNRPAGFDYLRLILSSLVILTHSINVSYGIVYTLTFWTAPIRPFVAAILLMFFALSGFLVAASLERCRTVGSFLALRVLRIVPALAVETVLAALLIGTLFTSLPLGQYFSDPQFARYFLNIVGYVNFFLPGVFADTPWPRYVNSQLWTLPYELYCYVTLAALALLGLVRRDARFVIVLVAVNIALFAFYWGIKKSQMGVTVSGPVLVLGFLYGLALNVFRDRVRWNVPLFVLAGAMTYICLRFEIGDYLAPLPAAYVTVYLGLLQPRRFWLVSSGDYSYGLFLYGFPIQQAVVATMGPAGRHWWVNTLVAWPITFLLAFLSWRFVESRMLRFKPAIVQAEGNWLARRSGGVASGGQLSALWARFRALPYLARIGLPAGLLFLVASGILAMVRRPAEDFPLMARMGVINAHIAEASPGYILVAGDSNAEMVNPAIRMCGRELVNAGISGAKIKDFVLHWRGFDLHNPPAAVLISIGTNDLHRKRNPLQPKYLAEFEKQAEVLARQAMASSKAVFLMAVPPAERSMTVYEPGAVVAFSERLKGVCARLGCTFVDPFAAARDGDTGLAKTGSTRDGIHARSYRKAMAGIEPQVCPKL